MILTSLSSARLEVGLIDSGVSPSIGLDLNLNPLDINYGGNYSINTNSSEWWNTNLGPLGNANSAQFDNIGGTLTIDESHIELIGNDWWLRRDGTNSPTANINWGSFDITNLNNITANNFLGGDGFFDNIYSKDEVDELIAGDLQLYFKNTTSGISTYLDMNRTANERPKNSTSQTISVTNTEIGAFISKNASDLGITGLDSGVVNGHFHANVDLVVGKKTVEGWFQLYIRNSTGSETLITSSHLVTVDVTEEGTFEAHAQILSDVDLNDSDRILIKLIANLSGAGGNPVLTTYIQGGTLSRLELGSLGINFLTTGQANKNYFRLDGTNIGDLNASSITLNDTTIEDWNEIGNVTITTNVSINFGANESNTSGPAIPWLFDERGVAQINAASPVASTIWEQVLSEIRNVAGNIFNFTGSFILSGNIDMGGNLTTIHGAKFWSNTTCAFISSPNGGTVQEICDP